MQGAKRFHHACYGVTHRLFIGHVDIPERDIVGAEVVDDVLRIGLVHVEDGDLDALGDIGLDGGPAQTGRSACDDGYFSCQIHDVLLLRLLYVAVVRNSVC